MLFSTGMIHASLSVMQKPRYQNKHVRAVVILFCQAVGFLCIQDLEKVEPSIWVMCSHSDLIGASLQAPCQENHK